MQIDLPDAKKILSNQSLPLAEGLTEEMIMPLVELLVNNEVVVSLKKKCIYIIIAEIE